MIAQNVVFVGVFRGATEGEREVQGGEHGTRRDICRAHRLLSTTHRHLHCSTLVQSTCRHYMADVNGVFTLALPMYKSRL